MKRNGLFPIVAASLLTLCLSPAAANADLIVDGGFESGVVSPGWNSFYAQSSTLGTWYAPLFGDRLRWEASGGNPDRYVGNNSSDPAGAAYPTAFYQAVGAPYSAGEYTFTFDYLNVDSGTDADQVISWAIWGYTETDSNDNFVNGNSIAYVYSQNTAKLLAYGDFAPGDTNGWESLTAVTVSIPSGLSRIIIGLGSDEFRPASTTDQIGFDNVSLAIPEPSTLVMLLGLGGLGLLACLRRRRGR